MYSATIGRGTKRHHRGSVSHNSTCYALTARKRESSVSSATVKIMTRALAPLVLFLSLLASPAAGETIRGGRSPPLASRRRARGPESCDLQQCFVPTYRDCFHNTSFECKALQQFEEQTPSRRPYQQATPRPTAGPSPRPTTAPIPSLKTVVQLPIQIVADISVRDLSVDDRTFMVEYISDTLRDGLEGGVELIAVEFAGTLAASDLPGRRLRGRSLEETARFPLRITLQIEGGGMTDVDMSSILELLRDRALHNLELYLRNRPGDAGGTSDLSLDFEPYSFDDLVDEATTGAPSPGPSVIGLAFKEGSGADASYVETVAESISHDEKAADNSQTFDEGRSSKVDAKDKADVLEDEQRGLVWWAWGFIAVAALAVVLFCAAAVRCCFRPSGKRDGHAEISHFVRNGATVVPVAFNPSEQQHQGKKRKIQEAWRARGVPPSGFNSIDVSRRSKLDSSHRSKGDSKVGIRRAGQSHRRRGKQTRDPPAYRRRRPKMTNRAEVEEAQEWRPRKIRRAISQTEIEERLLEAWQNDEESLCTAILPYVESNTRHESVDPPGRDHRTTARHSRPSRGDLDQSERSAGKTRKSHKQQGPSRKGRIPKERRVRKDEMFICPVTNLPRVASPQFEPTLKREEEDSQLLRESVCSKPRHIVCDAGTTCNSLISMGGADATFTAAGQGGGIKLGTGTPLPPLMGAPPPRRRTGGFAEMAARLSVKDDSDTLESTLESIDPFQ